MVIRKASLNDLKAVQNIAKETFYETFAEANTKEDMERYLADNFSDSKIEQELSNPDSQFYIVLEDEKSIGYLKINSGAAQTELNDEASLEIERIYVKKAYQGKKVGQILYEKALEIAQFQNKEYLWLGVWEENPKAIRFYEKNGFAAFDKHVFRFGDDEQTDIMMKKKLV